MQPNAIFNTDSTQTFGTTEINLTKTLSELFPTVNGEIDNSISINRYDSDVMKTVYSKSKTYDAIYDDSITYTAEPDAAGWVWKYYKRTSYPTDDVTINNAIVYGGVGENRVYAVGIKDDASDVYNYNDAGNLKFIRDLEYNKILFECYATEYSNFTILPKGTIQEGISEHPIPTMIDVELKDIKNERWYLGFNHRNAHIWNGLGWSDISARPILICNGDTVQSIQSLGKSFYSSINQYSVSVHTGDNLSIGVTSNNNLNFGYNFCNRLNKSDFTLGWNNSINTAPNWIDIPDTIIDAIKQWFIDNNIPTGYGNRHWFLLSSEIKNVSDTMGMSISVIGQFYLKNSTTIHCSAINECFYPMVKGSELLKMIAGFGCYYVADNTIDLTETTPDTLGDNSKIWLGAMNANGTTSGVWIKGNDINNYSGYNKDGNTNNPNYNPSGGGGGDADDVEKDMTTITASGNAGMVTYYEINKTGTATATQISDAISKFDITTIGKDLIRNLISYKAFAVLPIADHLLNIIHVSGKDLKDSNDNDLWGDTILSLGKISLGTVKVNAMYGDYRDYAPYTKIEMYVPFCGWFTLPSWVIGKTLSGDMWVDLYNGTVKAIIKASSTVVAEIGGCCAYDIPFVAESTGAKSSAVISSALATVGMTAATISTPNIATASAAISSAANLASALNANTTTLKGCLGDGSNVNGLNKIWVKITRPSRLNGSKEIPTAYKHEYGVPCGKQLTLTAGDGFTQIIDANITGAMTDREKQMIIDGFRHGLVL